MEDPLQGRRSGCPSRNSFFFNNISCRWVPLPAPGQGCCEATQGRSSTRSFVYIPIHDRVRSEIQVGKSWASTTSGWPAPFASRTPLQTPSYVWCPPCMHVARMISTWRRRRRFHRLTKYSIQPCMQERQKVVLVPNEAKARKPPSVEPCLCMHVGRQMMGRKSRHVYIRFKSLSYMCFARKWKWSWRWAPRT